MNNSVTYSLFMLVAGIGNPTMATLNGGLSGKLLSFTLATTISLAVGFTVTII